MNGLHQSSLSFLGSYHDYDGILDGDNHVCEHDHTNEVGRVALRRHRAEACAHKRNYDHTRNEQIGLGTNLRYCLILLHLEHTELSLGRLSKQRRV